MESKNNRDSIYLDLSDEEIIEKIRNGDRFAQDFLLNKYKSVVKTKSRAFFLIGADREDIIQEGMIGLYKAIRDFNPNKPASFKVFSDLCISRQIITAVKTATRQKHIPLNTSISLNKPIHEYDEQTYIDTIKERDMDNPETMVISQENRAFIETSLTKILSKFESRVLYLYLEGRSYAEIAGIIDKSEKSVDNALQRVKKKIEKLLNK